MGGHLDENKLDSWKAIADFLRRDVRTVQRWEVTEAMPVHRHPHVKRASVWAFKSELETWLHERKDLNAPAETVSEEPVSEELPAAVVPMTVSHRVRWVVVLSVVISAVSGWILWGVRTPTPYSRPARLGRLFARSTQEGGRFERINAGKTPVQLVITPDGGELYVSNLDDATVSVIQPRSRVVTHTLRVARQPGSMAISPDGRKVYVGSRISGLTIIDVETKTVTAMSTDGPVNSMAITHDGSRLFLAMMYRGLKRLAVSTGKIESIPVVGCPYELAIDPLGRRLYVSYRCGGPGGRAGWDAIDVMDIEREVSVGTVNGLPLVGGGIAVSPDNSQVWVSGSDRCSSTNYDHTGCPIAPGGLMRVIRTLDLKPIAALGLPIAQGQPSFYPDGSRAILIGSQLAEVRDTANFTVLENLAGSSLSGSVAFSPDGRSAFVAQSSPSGVVVLEPEPPDCEQLRFGLYHLWTADGNVNDSEGQNHGKVKEGFGFVPGRRGQALLLDGMGMVELSSDRGFLNWSGDLFQDEWTVSAWVKPFTTDTEAVVIGSTRKDYSWNLGQSGTGHWQFQIGNQALKSKTKAQLNRWHNLSVVHAQDRLSLYVDGVNESTVTLGHLARSPGVSAAIGADPRGGKFFRGLIDEVRIHQTALPDPTLRSIARGDRAVCEGAGLPPTQ